jgi:hypothetical protein
MRKALLIFVIIMSCSCIATNKNKKNEATINQLELQEDLQRFYTRFTERIVDTVYQRGSVASYDLQTSIRQYWLYDSEALKIVTAPFPMVNLLDMLVFIKLNKMVIKDYWIPKAYGKPGHSLLKAFEESEKDLKQIAYKVLTPIQYAQINQFIEDWRLENPHRVRVEKVRLADFSKYAKSRKKEESSFSLVDTSSAVQAVDQMVLVANRGIFLAQQIPSIIRLNARIGAQEILSDSVSTLQSAPHLAQELNQTNSLIDNAKDLVVKMDRLAKDTHSLVNLLPKNPKGGVNIKSGLNQIDSILENANILVAQMQEQQPVNRQKLKHIKKEFHALIWFLALVTVLVAFLISVSWWTGAYFYQRFTHRKPM